ncbi:hypothetical protein PFISCL1PPCAC_14434, partial [Pristionchus fissidentatus]
RRCRLDAIKKLLATSIEGQEVAPEIQRFSANIQSHSILHRIGENYGQLSALRRNGELKLRGIQMDGAVTAREEYEVVPCTYKFMNESVRIMIS